MTRKHRILLLASTFLFLGQVGYGQTNSLDSADKELEKIYSKIFPFYYGDNDSLNYYSDLFTKKLTDLIKTNPSSIDYKFKSLTDSNSCRIVTTKDGMFRIYSWDTWQGGTMHLYKNLYQFKSDGKVFTTVLNHGEDDMGAYFKDVFSLKANNKNYFLAICGGSYSTKDAYEIISVYGVSGNTLIDTIQLIKTPKGLQNSISFEYDFFSVVDRPERPLFLIKYDADKKIIYIPIVLENGKVTDRYILYQFNGHYFEHILTHKKNSKEK
jgi:hypothetical protein